MGQCAHLKNYVTVPDCEVVAIAELRSKMAQKVAAKYGVPHVYRDHGAVPGTWLATTNGAIQLPCTRRQRSKGSNRPRNSARCGTSASPCPRETMLQTASWILSKAMNLRRSLNGTPGKRHGRTDLQAVCRFRQLLYPSSQPTETFTGRTLPRYLR